jgi:biotin--protein ligase
MKKLINIMVFLFVICISIQFSQAMVAEDKEKVCTRKIAIYNGPGVALDCLMHTSKTFSTFPRHYEVKFISAEEIKESDWVEETSLFIMPGGADIPYTKSLNGDGNQKIREYVERGGSFLGICAGAYYSGNSLEFAPGTDMEVLGERELAFFDGLVRGPCLAPYVYNSGEGSRAASLNYIESNATLSDKTTLVYYNGGGLFVGAKSMPGIKVLATYNDLLGDEAAIIECIIGKGKVILSGVHFEFDPFLLEEADPHLKDKIPLLRESNENRLELVRIIMRKLNIDI